MDRNFIKFEKILMASSLIRKYDVIVVILMSRQIKKWKVFVVSLFLMDEAKRWCKGLISNLISKMKYQSYEKIPLFFSSIMIFSQALPHELVSYT